MTRRGNAGGRHVAMERGLRPGWCGWPFRRELRELAAKCFVGQRSIRKRHVEVRS
jgi:hypothetical protein